MAFGFDSSIILQQRRADPMGAARSMADLLQTRQAMAQRAEDQRLRGEEHRMTLAGLLRKQEQEQRLAEIYRQHADKPDAVGSALMREGFGAEGLALIQRAAQAEAARQEAIAKAENEKRRLTETERHHREMEKRPSGSPPLTIITGADGTYHMIDPRRPQAPAVAVTDAQGKPVAKALPQKASKPLNLGDRDRLEALHGQARAADELLSRFKDTYAGKGFLGGSIVAGKQALGSWAPGSAQEEAAFWADFGKMVDLPERNKTFGASLTEGEKRAWEGAKNIKPGASPAVVRAAMEKMKEIAQQAAQRRGRSLVADGFNPEAIEQFTGPLASSGGLSADEAAELAELEAEGF